VTRPSPRKCKPSRSNKEAPTHSLRNFFRERENRTIVYALTVSLLIHAAAFLRLPPFHLSIADQDKRGQMPDSLTVELAPMPQPRPRAPSAPRPQVSEKRLAPPPSHPPRPAKPPPPRDRQILALKEPAPQSAPAVRPLPRPPQTAPAPAPPAADLASYVEARRRARGEAAPAESAPAVNTAEAANARANRLAAANLAAGRDRTFGVDPNRSGGVFSLQRMTSDYAEFRFFGWNREIQRNAAQLVAVQRGSAPDIRIAVVRKMIGIIREYEDGDFVWESERLGRNITLSARQRDNAGLEDFMMREFFPEWRRP
jgi:outer membrane biosynthesis protein TonB